MTVQELDFSIRTGESVVSRFETAAEEKQGWGSIFKSGITAAPILAEPYVVTNQRLVVLGRRSYKIVNQFPLGGLGARTENVIVRNGRQIGDVGFFKDGQCVVVFNQVVGPQQVVALVMSIQNQQWAERNKKVSLTPQ